MAFGRDSIESVSTPSSIELEEKFCRIKNLPEMVRLLTAATLARTAGRAALTAIWEARREAKTREEAIVIDL
jgi:capsule polysaccharide export protein KpsE/RkpR